MECYCYHYYYINIKARWIGGEKEIPTSRQKPRLLDARDDKASHRATSDLLQSVSALLYTSTAIFRATNK